MSYNYVSITVGKCNSFNYNNRYHFVIIPGRSRVYIYTFVTKIRTLLLCVCVFLNINVIYIYEYMYKYISKPQIRFIIDYVKNFCNDNELRTRV